MLTALYLALSLLAALGLYLACAHQRLRAVAPARRGVLRASGWACAFGATLAAIAALGPWAGVFAALTAIMLGAVLLPYLDAWRQLRGRRGDVG